MKTMPITKFNKDNVIKEIGHDIESDIYLYRDKNNVVTFKKFRKDFDALGNLYDPSNKELKLLLLNESKALINDIKLLKRVYDEDQFIGYTSCYEPHKTLESFAFTSKKKRINFLEQIQQKYQELNKEGIYIGDFNEKNFAVFGDNIRLLNIDNFRIGDIDFDIKDTVMKDYLDRCPDNIKNIDYFCFNYFVMSYISKIAKSYIFWQLYYNDLPKEFKTEECKKIYQKLLKINDKTKVDLLPNGDQKTMLKEMKRGLFN